MTKFEVSDPTEMDNAGWQVYVFSEFRGLDKGTNHIGAEGGVGLTRENQWAGVYGSTSSG